MSYFVTICTLFVVGAVGGWVIELFFRRFFSQKRWVNPGFMVGPYLPLYGFGIVIFYAICRLCDLFTSVPLGWLIVIKIVLIIVLATLLEFIAGLIFIKGMGIKLWDYSNQPGNIMGIICPLFSLLWGVVGAIYVFLLDDIVIDGLNVLSENIIYCFFIGIVLGMMLVDFAYSIHLGLQLKKAAENNKMLMRYDEFKVQLRDKMKASNEKFKTTGAGVAFLKAKDQLTTTIQEFNENMKKPRKTRVKNKKSKEIETTEITETSENKEEEKE